MTEIYKLSLTDWLVSLPAQERAEQINKLSKAELRKLLYHWPLWARPDQLASQSEWRVWMILAGRGWGKTRTGAEWIRNMVQQGKSHRVALVAPTYNDVRAVMVEGESGILSISPPGERPKWEPSLNRLTWANGAVGYTFSADEPDRLRGPQHDAAWCDELAAWRKPETWDMLQFGLRLGDNPQTLITTTPRPTKLIKKLITDSCVVTRGSTFDNAANLAPGFLQSIRDKYDGTRLGRQELYAEILSDTPGALWNREMIEDSRGKLTNLSKIVIGVDPAVSNNASSAETGIIVAGLGEDGNVYIIDDMSCSGSPLQWAQVVEDAYNQYEADFITAEVNNGGDLIISTLHTVNPSLPIRPVRASRDKYTRAQPVAALFEKGRVKLAATFSTLEDQMCEWVPGSTSPDRLDAMVWAVSSLLINPQGKMVISV
jgi:predicted phage terminase large subunit-like protein